MEFSNDVVAAAESPSFGISLNGLQNDDIQQDSAQETTSSNSLGKTPKRVLHFSDGVLEEYSTDEDEEPRKPELSNAVDKKRLTWPQYILHATTTFGSGTLKVCDYVGEGLANFFGITTPKYQYEINEYERMKKQQEEAEKKEDAEMRGWRNVENNESPSVISSSPASVEAITESQGRY